MNDVKNLLELYTFVVFDVLYEFSGPRQHEFDGHLVDSNTNFKTFTDFEIPDPNTVFSRTCYNIYTYIHIYLYIYINVCMCIYIYLGLCTSKVQQGRKSGGAEEQEPP